MLIAMSVQRMAAAAGSEMPRPVKSSTYVARHAGHFGISASVVTGSAETANVRTCRRHPRA